MRAERTWPIVGTPTSAITSGLVPVITWPARPAGITDLTATAGGESICCVDLDWSAPNNRGSAITGYKIERETPIDGGWSTIVADTGTTDTAYQDEPLDWETEYNYRVRAINAVGVGSRSNEAADTTGTNPGLGADNLLLETGDNLILESGGVLLLEA